jgi:hypothetical protein
MNLLLFILFINSHAFITKQSWIGGARKPLPVLQVSLDNETNLKKPLTVSSTTESNLGYSADVLDPSTYEASLLRLWDEDIKLQKGFDWEIEKLRRFSSGLYQLEDGTWAKRPSIFNFLINKSRVASAAARRVDEPPKPVNIFDVGILFATQILSSIGLGPMLGMAAVPDAVIQKYEGSFYSFIKGVLGGDLQTLAGGPLFLLLAKYYQDYGPIFNLSFGPKSFVVVSDPVMARHILKSNPENYCKGMLAEILEPIMGNGLIPADPATWKVRSYINVFLSSTSYFTQCTVFEK